METTLGSVNLKQPPRRGHHVLGTVSVPAFKEAGHLLKMERKKYCLGCKGRTI